MAWKAIIAGVDHTHDIQTAQPVQFTRLLNERATAQFRCKPGFVPNRFDPVIFYDTDGVTPRFNGIILNRTIAGFKQRGGGEPYSTDVQCGDGFTYLDWAYLNLTYTAPATVKQILTDIIAALPADTGITLDPAQLDGPPVDPFTWSQMRASDAVRDLSQRTGYVALMSPTKTLAMFAPGSQPAPFTITDAAPHCQTIVWTDNPYVPANDAIAVCGPSAPAVTTQFWTVGAPSTWQVDIQNVIGAWNRGLISENGAIDRTVSPPGQGGYYEFDPTAGRGTVSVGSGVKPAAGTVLSFVYTAAYPFTVHATTGADPVIQYQQQYPNILDYSQGQETVQGLLAQLNQQPRDLTVTSLDTGWQPGEALTVDLTARLTSTFVITSVTLTLQVRKLAPVWIASFVGTESNTYQGSYLDQWRALTGTGGTSSGIASAPPINTGGGGGGGVAGTGTAGRLAEWTAATTLGNGPIAADVILATGSYTNPSWLTAIGLDKLAPIAAQTLLGNAGGSAAPPTALSAAASRAVLGLATTDAPTFAGLILTGGAVIGGSATIAGNVGTPTYVAQTTGWRITPAGAADARSLYADTATIAGTLTLGGNLTIAGFVGSPTYTQQLTGWRITAAGAADVRYLYADELHTKAFIADLEQALAGGQIISKSVAKVATTANGGFRVGTDTQLLVESFAGFATAAVFQDGDTVRLRAFARAAGALTVTDAFGTVTLDTTYSAGGYDAGTMTQRYTFTKTSGTNILANTGTLALDYGVSGNGYYEVTAVDGAWGAAAPYAQVVTWSGTPSTLAVRTRLGNLFGVLGTPGEFGLFAGDYSGKRYLRASSAGVELHGLDFLLWDGTINTFKLNHAVPSFAMGNPIPTAYGTGGGTGMWMGKDTDGVYKFRVGTPGSAGMFWDGTALTITGVSGGALTGIPAGGAASDVNTYSTTINGGKITTGTVTANKLLVTAAGASLNADPTFEDMSNWTLYQGVKAVGAAGHGNFAIFSTNPSGSYCQVTSEYLPIDRTKVYRVSAWGWQSGTANGGWYIGFAEYDSNKAYLTNTYAVAGINPTTSAVFYQGQLQPANSNTAYVQVIALLNYAGTAGQHALANLRLEEMAPSTLIQDGAITTAKISAGAVTAGKLFVGNDQAINDDPSCSDASAWILAAAGIGLSTYGSPHCIISTGSIPGSAVSLKLFPVSVAKTYRYHCYALRSSDANGVLYVGLYHYDYQGNQISWTYPAAAAITPGTGWAPYEGIVSVANGMLPSNAVNVQLLIYLNYGATTGYMAITDVRLEEMSPSTLIQDGAITTQKIFAQAVTAAQIAAGTITSGQIAASTITGGNIAAGTITAGNLSAGTITAGQIAAGTITSTQIAARSITADRIVTRALTANEIQAGTITANEIAVQSITADRLTVGVLSAISANLGNITAGSINAVTINGSTIAGGTVTGGSGTITLDSGGLHFSGSGGNAVIDMNGISITHIGGGGPGWAASINIGGFLAVQNDLNVNGSIYCPNMNIGAGVNVTWTAGTGTLLRQSSSRRYKQNERAWRPPRPGHILDAQPTLFDFISSGQRDVLGFIAEDLYALDPHLVVLDAEGRPEAIHNEAMLAHVVVAIQDVARRLSALEGHA